METITQNLVASDFTLGERSRGCRCVWIRCEDGKDLPAKILTAFTTLDAMAQENARAHESYEGMNAAYQQLNDECAKLVEALKEARYDVQARAQDFKRPEAGRLDSVDRLRMIDAALKNFQ